MDTNFTTNNDQTSPVQPVNFGLSSQDSNRLPDTSNVSAMSPTPPVINPQPYPTGINYLPEVAADIDVIEKEWVGAIEDAVSRTIEDPHAQQEEISRIKADYMKKRYNKNIQRGD